MREGRAVGRGRRGRFAGALRAALSLAVAAGLAAGAGASARRVVAQDDANLTGRTATVARSEDGVNLRTEPGFAGDIVGTLPDGTVVELRVDEVDTVLDEDGETRWWPVRVDGQEGWVAGYYLDQGGEAASTDSGEVPADTTADEAPAPDGAITGTAGNARVTSEDGANFRAEPGQSGEVIAVLAFDTVVELRVDEADTVVRGGVRWWPVRVDGQEGWIAGDYLADADGVVVADNDIGDTDDTASAPSVFALGEYVAAMTGSQDGVNIRAGAGTENERVGFIPEGDVVQVMDGPVASGDSGSGWYLVTDGDVTGYVDGDLLAVADQPPAPPADADPVQDEPVLDPVFFVAGDFAAAGDGGVNVRSSASRDAGVVSILATGTVVEVLGGPEYDADGDGWYLVSDGATNGYANGNYLLASAAPASAAPSAPAAGVATGSFIIPLSGYVFTQAYGCSPYVFEPYDANIGCNFHNGVDLAAAAGTPLMAADGGIVKYAGWCDCGLGYYVEIDHGNGFATVYGHMSELWVATGQAVVQGEVIGLVGSTGLSTGPHVHFMVKLNGSTVDPLGYLPPV